MLAILALLKGQVSIDRLGYWDCGSAELVVDTRRVSCERIITYSAMQSWLKTNVDRLMS